MTIINFGDILYWVAIFVGGFLTGYAALWIIKQRWGY